MSQRFVADYYTGTQAGIYVGDVWIDEAFGVQFQATQNMVPLYSFASSRFDAVAKGKVLVQGYFEINFVHNGYLYAVLSKASADAEAEKQAAEDMTAREEAKEVHDALDDAAIYVSQKQAAGTPQFMDLGLRLGWGLQDIVTAPLPDSAQVEEVGEQVALLKQLKALEGTDDDSEPQVVGNWNRTMNSLMNNLAAMNIASVGKVASMLTRVSQQGDSDGSVIYTPTAFKLVGLFGRPSDAKVRGTYKEIRNCFLISNEMIVASDDQPVRERYAFIAQYHV